MLDRLRHPILAIGFLLTLLVVPFDAGFAQQRGPSTPEERTRVVEVARALEQSPLDKDNKKGREWALAWVIQVPDLTIKVCTDLLGPVAGSKKNYSSELIAQMIISSAAFAIEHPDKATNDTAVSLAGVEGTLKAYEAILREKPKARHEFLDELVQERAKGQLAGYVEDTMKKCK